MVTEHLCQFLMELPEFAGEKFLQPLADLMGCQIRYNRGVQAHSVRIALPVDFHLGRQTMGSIYLIHSSHLPTRIQSEIREEGWYFSRRYLIETLARTLFNFRSPHINPHQRELECLAVLRGVARGE